MSKGWPNLQALELFVAVVDEGSVGAGARKVGMAQPNATRVVAGLEVTAGTALLDRTPRGSIPTTAGLRLADLAREVLDCALRFNDHFLPREEGGAGGVLELRVGASMTIAECLLPAWLAQLRRFVPRVRVDLRVLNSAEVIAQVRAGALQLGFVETPRLPVGLNATVVQDDELVVVVASDHPWAERRSAVSLQELAQTALVVRESGSGTREALDELLANLDPVEPAQVLFSNAAVRVAVASGQAPAALSRLAVRNQLASGELLQVPLETRVNRPLTAVWSGPQRLTGQAAELVMVARDSPS
ncbi:MAG: LysR family transcriptional regulator [Marmoricola sp.]